MSAYNIIYASSVKKQITKIESGTLKAIFEKIEDTAKDPYKHSSKVKNPNLPRRKIRVRSFRVLFDLDDDAKEMHVKAIKPRSEVYE